MAFNPVKTTYEESDMNRLNRAPQKICAFYEQKGSYQPVFDQKFDSGFSEFSEDSSGRPVPPKLLGVGLVDTENGDSGVYMDDEVECDRVNVASRDTAPEPQKYEPVQKMSNLSIANTKPEPSTAPSLVVKTTQSQKAPRRPRVNYSVMAPTNNPTTNSGTSTTVQAGRPTTSQNVTYTTNNKSIQSTRVASRGPISLPPEAHRPNNTQLGEVRRRNQLNQNQPSSLPASIYTANTFSQSATNWPRIDIFELQQNVQYFLPNRDGDTYVEK